MYDVLIAGGGPAGLSAALLLGRSRRSVLLCDGDAPRNGVAATAHSFLTRDGTPPAELRWIAREQLGVYEGVEYSGSPITSLSGEAGAFSASLACGRAVDARVVIIATGVEDVLPSINGIARLWGTSVVHCPYCDGWEVRDEPLALLQNDEDSARSAITHRQWSRDFALLTNGSATLTGVERAELAAKNVLIYETPILRLEPAGAGVRILLADGSSVWRRAIFIRPPQRPRSELAVSLGCVIDDEDPNRAAIAVDAFGRTSVPGVFAAGDVAIVMQHLAEVVGSGSTAGVMANVALAAMDRAAESAALGLPPIEEQT